VCPFFEDEKCIFVVLIVFGYEIGAKHVHKIRNMILDMRRISMKELMTMMRKNLVV